MGLICDDDDEQAHVAEFIPITDAIVQQRFRLLTSAPAPTPALPTPSLRPQFTCDKILLLQLFILPTPPAQSLPWRNVAQLVALFDKKHHTTKVPQAPVTTAEPQPQVQQVIKQIKEEQAPVSIAEPHFQQVINLIHRQLAATSARPPGRPPDPPVDKFYAPTGRPPDPPDDKFYAHDPPLAPMPARCTTPAGADLHAGNAFGNSGNASGNSGNLDRSTDTPKHTCPDAMKSRDRPENVDACADTNFAKLDAILTPRRYAPYIGYGPFAPPQLPPEPAPD